MSILLSKNKNKNKENDPSSQKSTLQIVLEFESSKKYM